MVFNKQSVTWFPYVPDFADNLKLSADQQVCMEMRRVSGHERYELAGKVNNPTNDIFAWRNKTFANHLSEEKGKVSATTPEGHMLLASSPESLHIMKLMIDHIRNVQNVVAYEGQQPITDVVEFVLFSMDVTDPREEKANILPDGSTAGWTLFDEIGSVLREGTGLSGEALENFIAACAGSPIPSPPEVLPAQQETMGR